MPVCVPPSPGRQDPRRGWWQCPPLFPERGTMPGGPQPPRQESRTVQTGGAWGQRGRRRGWEGLALAAAVSLTPSLFSSAVRSLKPVRTRVFSVRQCQRLYASREPPVHQRGPLGPLPRTPPCPGPPEPVGCVSLCHTTGTAPVCARSQPRPRVTLRSLRRRSGRVCPPGQGG